MTSRTQIQLRAQGWLLLILTIASPAYAQSHMVEAPHPLTAYPDVASSSFEATAAVAERTSVNFGAAVPSQWASWRFVGTAGVAHEDSPVAGGGTMAAPDGDYVGFVTGHANIEGDYSFAAGTYRLHFQAASTLAAGGAQTLEVYVGTTKVGEWAIASGYDEYVSRPVEIALASMETVSFIGAGPSTTESLLVDDVRLEMIRVWDDPTTWVTQAVPGPSDTVAIPTGHVVALRGSGEAENVTVNGELVVADTNTTLSSEWVMVTGSGARFEVGLPSTPFLGEFELELKGDETSTPMGPAERKFLMAMVNGVIEMHGKPKRSWTKLSDEVFGGPDADNNDEELKLVDAVDWEVGDQIALADTIFYDAQPPTGPYDERSDKVTITAVSPDGKTVWVADDALINNHHASAPTPYMTIGPAHARLSQSWELDVRAEAGLLTRNIKIRGDATSEANKFGGQVMIMRMANDPSSVTGSGRFSNVEFFHMGQAGKLGRYPIHWHMLLDKPLTDEQYVRDCSVHRCFNRAVTVHGTDGVHVEGNVVHDTFGHAIFLEDGSEQFNVIKDNLVMRVLRPTAADALLPTDIEFDSVQNRSPAAFWITNPMNQIDGNVAAGTQGTGFWFALPHAPLGVSGDSSSDIIAKTYFSGRSPIATALGSFDGNTAHNCAAGFDVNDSIDENDELLPANPWEPPSGHAVIPNFTAWNCHIGIYSGLFGDNLTYENAILAENRESIRLAAAHVVTKSLIVARAVTDGPFVSSGFVTYDGPGRLEHCHFAGFDESSPATAIQETGGATHRPHSFYALTHEPLSLASVTFVQDFSVNPAMSLPPEAWSMTLRDEDGSLWGYWESTITSNHDLVYIAGSPAELAIPSGAPFFSFTTAKVTHLRYAYFRIDHPGFVHGTTPDVSITRESNGAGFPASQTWLHNSLKFAHKGWPLIVDDRTPPSGPLLADYVYTLDWPAGFADTGAIGEFQLRFTLSELNATDSVILRLTGVVADALPGEVAISGATQVMTMPTLESASENSYYEDPSGDLILRFVGNTGTSQIDVSW